MGDLTHENKIRKALGLPPIPEKKPTHHTNQSNIGQSVSSMIESGKDISIIIKKAYKAINPNAIPKKFEDVMALKEQMKKENEQMQMKADAIKEIRAMQKVKAERILAIKKARRAKIKRFLHI